jgi:hypothetical protein
MSTIAQLDQYIQSNIFPGFIVPFRNTLLSSDNIYDKQDVMRTSD